MLFFLIKLIFSFSCMHQTSGGLFFLLIAYCIFKYSYKIIKNAGGQRAVAVAGIFLSFFFFFKNAGGERVKIAPY